MLDSVTNYSSHSLDTKIKYGYSVVTCGHMQEVPKIFVGCWCTIVNTRLVVSCLSNALLVTNFVSLTKHLTDNFVWFKRLLKLHFAHMTETVAMKKALREMQTLRAGCSKAEPKTFAPPQTPSCGHRTAKI